MNDWLRMAVRVALLYLAFGLALLLLLAVEQAVRPHDLDCNVVGPSELYCQVAR